MPTDTYPLQDLLYRTTALTDDGGDIVEAYDTDAYGNTLIFNAAGTGGDWWTDDAQQTDEPTCEFIFTGRRYDVETELYFYRRRYYKPASGSFISRDPITFNTPSMRQTHVDVLPIQLRLAPTLQWEGHYAAGILRPVQFRTADFQGALSNLLNPRPSNRLPMHHSDVSLFQYSGSNPTRRSDALGLWWWDADWISGGLGGLLGFHGSEAATAGWNAYSEASYGFVGTFTGGLFDEDYGFLGNADDVKRWLEQQGVKDPSNESAYDFGKNAGRVSESALLAAAVLELFGIGIKCGFHNHPGGPHNYPHFQVNWWIKGVKGSGGAWRVP
jgi:RHS repeat-associated protein